MTTAIWIRAALGLEWHRLTVVGQEHHGVACVLGAVPTDEPVLLSSSPPAAEPRCIGCARDLAARLQRVPTVDLRPRVWTGEVADLDVTTEADDDWGPDSDALRTALHEDLLDLPPAAPDRVALHDPVSGPIRRRS